MLILFIRVTPFDALTYTTHTSSSVCLLFVYLVLFTFHSLLFILISIFVFQTFCWNWRNFWNYSRKTPRNKSTKRMYEWRDNNWNCWRRGNFSQPTFVERWVWISSSICVRWIILKIRFHLFAFRLDTFLWRIKLIIVAFCLCLFFSGQCVSHLYIIIVLLKTFIKLSLFFSIYSISDSVSFQVYKYVCGCVYLFFSFSSINVPYKIL